MKQTGIYKIENPCGQVYIGQTFDFKKRISHYSDTSNVKSLVHSSIRKFGRDSHRVSLIHELPNDIDRSILDIYEQVYIDAHKDCGIELFNIRDGGRYAKLHPSSIAKIIKSKTGVKLNISEENRQAKRALMLSSNYAKGIKHTDKQKIAKSELMKVSEWRLPSKKVLCLNNGVIYNSHRDAAKELGISYKHIPCVCKGRRNHTGGFKFKDA